MSGDLRGARLVWCPVCDGGACCSEPEGIYVLPPIFWALLNVEVEHGREREVLVLELLVCLHVVRRCEPVGDVHQLACQLEEVNTNEEPFSDSTVCVGPYLKTPFSTNSAATSYRAMGSKVTP